MLNTREKFNAVLNFQQNSKNLKVEYGFWAGTIRSWLKNGLPKIKDISNNILDSDLIRASAPLISNNNEMTDKNVMTYFSLDPYPSKFPHDFSPILEKKVTEENNEYKIFFDEYGRKQKVLKEGSSVPMVLDYSIKTSKDFYKYKELYDDDYYKRLPKDWEILAENLRNRNFAIRLGGHPYGFSGMPRHLMGDVNYMMSMYDNPKLIKDINEFYLNFVMNYWSKILDKIEIDWVMVWEDMAFRAGSFISSEMFREFLSPYYIKLVDFLKQYHIKNIIVDSDGLIEELIPLWLEVGVTGVFPLEAVNDLIKIRKMYPKLQMLGGINKKILINGSKKEIDDELEKISLLIKKGGYIPHIDHSVSQDAEWESFKYYREELNRVIDEI